MNRIATTTSKDGYARFYCEWCEQRLKALPRQAGRGAICPNCRKPVRIPPQHALQQTRLVTQVEPPLLVPLPSPPPQAVSFLEHGQASSTDGGQSEYIRSFFGILNGLPPLNGYKSPTTSAVLGLLGGGIALWIYFCSFIDFIVLLFEGVLISVLLSFASHLPPAEKAVMGWLLGVLFASLYGYFRARTSNARLDPAQHQPASHNCVLAVCAFLWIAVAVVATACLITSTSKPDFHPNGGKMGDPAKQPQQVINLVREERETNQLAFKPEEITTPMRRAQQPDQHLLQRWLLGQEIKTGDGGNWRIDPGEIRHFKINKLFENVENRDWRAEVEFEVFDEVKQQGGMVTGIVRSTADGDRVVYQGFEGKWVRNIGRWIADVWTVSLSDGQNWKSNGCFTRLDTQGKFTIWPQEGGLVIAAGSYVYDGRSLTITRNEHVEFRDRLNFVHRRLVARRQVGTIRWEDDNCFVFTIIQTDDPSAQYLREVPQRFNRK